MAHLLPTYLQQLRSSQAARRARAALYMQQGARLQSVCCRLAHGQHASSWLCMQLSMMYRSGCRSFGSQTSAQNIPADNMALNGKHTLARPRFHAGARGEEWATSQEENAPTEHSSVESVERAGCAVCRMNGAANASQRAPCMSPSSPSSHLQPEPLQPAAGSRLMHDYRLHKVRSVCCVSCPRLAVDVIVSHWEPSRDPLAVLTATLCEQSRNWV